MNDPDITKKPFCTCGHSFEMHSIGGRCIALLGDFDAGRSTCGCLIYHPPDTSGGYVDGSYNIGQQDIAPRVLIDGMPTYKVSHSADNSRLLDRIAVALERQATATEQIVAKLDVLLTYQETMVIGSEALPSFYDLATGAFNWSSWVDWKRRQIEKSGEKPE